MSGLRFRCLVAALCVGLLGGLGACGAASAPEGMVTPGGAKSPYSSGSATDYLRSLRPVLAHMDAAMSHAGTTGLTYEYLSAARREAEAASEGLAALDTPPELADETQAVVSWWRKIADAYQAPLNAADKYLAGELSRAEAKTAVAKVAPQITKLAQELEQVNIRWTDALYQYATKNGISAKEAAALLGGQ